MVLHRLPENLYQTAKISKLLLLMEKGADEYKGKSLSQIEINPETEFAEEDSENEDGNIVSSGTKNMTEYLQGT